MSRDLAKLQQENRKLKESYAALQGKMTEFEKGGAKAMRQVAKETEAADKAAKDAKSTFESYLGGMVSGAAAATAALKLVSAEIENIRKLQEDAARATMSLADSQQYALQNMGLVDKATAKKNFETLKAIAKETGVLEKDINIAFGAAAAASGGNVPLTLQATRVAAKWVPQNREDMTEVATGLVGLRQKSGFRDPLAELGVLYKTGEISRISKPKDLAANATQAINTLVGEGATMAEATAIYGLLTNASQDRTGEKTRSFTNRFSDYVGKSFGGVERSILTDQFPVFQGVAGALGANSILTAAWDAKTFGERVGFMQGHPTMSRLFMDSLGDVESTAKQPLEDWLLRPGVGLAKRIREATEAMPKDEAGWIQAGAKAIGQRAYAPTETVAVASRTASQAAESALTENIPKAMAGELSEKLQSLLRSTGAGAVDLWIADKLFLSKTQTGTDPRTAYADIAEQRSRYLASPYSDNYNYGPLGGMPSPPPEARLKSAQTLNVAAQDMRRLVVSDYTDDQLISAIKSLATNISVLSEDMQEVDSFKTDAKYLGKAIPPSARKWRRRHSAEIEEKQGDYGLLIDEQTRRGMAQSTAPDMLDALNRQTAILERIAGNMVNSDGLTGYRTAPPSWRASSADVYREMGVPIGTRALVSANAGGA